MCVCITTPSFVCALMPYLHFSGGCGDSRRRGGDPRRQARVRLFSFDFSLSLRRSVEESSSGSSAARNFNKNLYQQCLKDSKKKRSSLRSSEAFTRQSISKFAAVVSSMSEDHKAVVRRYGFGSLLLFDKCFVPKKFSKWLASLVESKSGDLIVQGKVISLTAQSVNLVLGIPVGGTPFPSDYSAGKDYVLSKIGKTTLPQVSFFVDKLKAADLNDEVLLVCFLVVALHCFLCPNSNIVPSPRYLGVFEDIEHINSYDWSGFVLRWLLDGVKNFNKGNKASEKHCGTLAGCMFYLA
ncbi:hypothetical protein BDA96_04G250100, partial [Sorghum bicolor]